jgi:electron transport complex protein RnfG
MDSQRLGIIITALKLCLICAVAAVSLGVINAITEPQIIARKVREEKDVLSLLVPDGKPVDKVSVEKEGVVKAYYPVDKDGSLFGYILDLEGIGYGGEMKILAAYRKDGVIYSVRLLDNTETPGLGKKAESPDYMNKFKGTGSEDMPVPTNKEMLQTDQGGPQEERKEGLNFRSWFLGRSSGGAADGVSGATITFLGISKALVEGSNYVKRELGGK